ncbi:hypothetical protein ACN28S_14925 [Cystobacter fuscus]
MPECPALHPRGALCGGRPLREHLEESCRTAMETLARRADQCHGGKTPESYQRLADAESVCASVVASVQAGRQAFVPERFGACVRQLRDVPCGALTLEEFTQGNLLARCEALEPQAAEGSACGGNLDCQGGWCDTSAGCPGVCKRYVPAGSACDGSVPCQPGSTCALNVCRASANLGESCAWGCAARPRPMRRAWAMCVSRARRPVPARAPTSARRASLREAGRGGECSA